MDSGNILIPTCARFTTSPCGRSDQLRNNSALRPVAGYIVWDSGLKRNFLVQSSGGGCKMEILVFVFLECMA
jgi:hypothetical protein